MLDILGHRGLWASRSEGNSPAALERCLAAGLGLETDIRDSAGAVVISHDPPNGGEQALAALLEDHRRLAPEACLALNIKADGLHAWLPALLAAHPRHAYFCFDMSIPSALQLHRSGLRIFTRHSDVEPVPHLQDLAEGVWLDAFHSEWWTADTVAEHVRRGREVCVVSPELHGRPHLEAWSRLRVFARDTPRRVMLCTDHPLEAREYFRG